MFSWKFCEIFKNTFFYRTPPGDCFWISKAMLKLWFIFHIQNLWYNFTRDNSFLQTPWQSLNGTGSLSLSPSRHIENTTGLMCIISSILNCSYVNQTNLVINRWKYRSKGLLKAIFTKKIIEKGDKLCMSWSLKNGYFTPTGKQNIM